jgi:drug/metabolite transporter (DMT)-like permease
LVVPVATFYPTASSGEDGTMPAMSDRLAVGQTQHARSLVALHAAVLLFGFAGLFGKWLALPPVMIVCGRTLIASLALALILRLFRERDVPRNDGFEWRLVAGGALLAVHWISFFQAIQTASVAVGLLGFASFPLFVLLLEWGLQQRGFQTADALTATAVAAGLLLVVPTFTFENRVVQGLAWGLLSGFTFALLAVGNRALATRHSAGSIALWQNAAAAVLSLPLAAAAWTTLDAREIGLLLVLGIACTALAHTLFIRSLRVLSAHTASVVAALEPVYGIVFAFLLVGEIPTPRMLVGGALILGGAFFATVRTP